MLKSHDLPRLKDAFNEKTTETEIGRSIRRYLDMKGIFNWPTHAGQIIPARTGISDIIAVLPKSGRILAIETKLPGWKFNPKSRHELQQRKFLENIRKSGGIAFFATTIDDVINGLMLKNELPPLANSDIVPFKTR